MSSGLFFTEIPVQIGSNKMVIYLNEFKKHIVCKEFLEIVLKKCKLNGLAIMTYSVFEQHANGIERFVGQNENIIELWKKNKMQKSFKFVIRKKQQQQAIQMFINKKTKVICNDVEAQVSKKRKIDVVDIKNNNNNLETTTTKTTNSKNSNNFLQFLYIKLKQQQNNYKILVDKQHHAKSCCSNESFEFDDDADCSRVHLKTFF
jgi:hypothetical protein